MPEPAYMFYIPVSQLATGFRQHFYIGIETFTHMLKMMTPYDLMQSDTSDEMDKFVIEYYKDQYPIC